jgi:predicted dehydrogenase
MNIAIIGCGYWGNNLIRNFYSAKNSKLSKLVDVNLSRLEYFKNIYKDVEISDDFEGVIADKSIDAVVIATPVHTHYNLAKMALLQGKHVLVEKPFTSKVSEAEDLINLAIQKNLVLMVDHTFLYTSAVQKMRAMIDNNEIGKPTYFDSTRINLGLFQPDVNVLWDLAPHDISILSFLIDEKPYSVHATGISHTHNKIENMAYLTVNYQSDFIAHFNCSWTSPVKLRTLLLGGDKKMILYNDLEPSEKIRVYDTGYSVKNDEDANKILVDYRVGDIFIPKLENFEALSSMAADFISSIHNSKLPTSDYNSGLYVVKVLEASQESIKNKGKEVVL